MRQQSVEERAEVCGWSNASSRVLAVDACLGGGQTCPGLGTAGRQRVPIPGRVFDWWRPPKCADWQRQV
jgi:hypothetical protein